MKQKEMAEQYQAQAIEQVQGGEDAADVIQALMGAGLSLARVWMSPEDVAAYLRVLAEQVETAGAEFRQKDH